MFIGVSIGYLNFFNSLNNPDAFYIKEFNVSQEVGERHPDEYCKITKTTTTRITATYADVFDRCCLTVDRFVQVIDANTKNTNTVHYNYKTVQPIL